MDVGLLCGREEFEIPGPQGSDPNGGCVPLGMAIFFGMNVEVGAGFSRGGQEAVSPEFSVEVELCTVGAFFFLPFLFRLRTERGLASRNGRVRQGVRTSGCVPTKRKEHPAYLWAGPRWKVATQSTTKSGSAWAPHNYCTKPTRGKIPLNTSVVSGAPSGIDLYQCE